MKQKVLSPEKNLAWEDIATQEETTLDISHIRGQEQIKIQEPNLIQSFSPLFLEESFQDSNENFDTSQYNNLDIRYKNLIKSPNLSIDYIFFEDKLIITTSKESIRAILDKINSDSPFQ